MPDLPLLAVFIPTFLFVSVTPGLCMTLAMTLGMSIGVRRTLWMMLGEVLGVAAVAIASVLGVATLMLNYPLLFQLLKYLGGAYLLYLAFTMWRAKGQTVLEQYQLAPPASAGLFLQGLLTAIANPKGWAFMIALLPPFLSPAKPLAGQLTVLILIIMLSEFICMLAYASGGKSLSLFFRRGNNLRWLNRIAASLLGGVGLWLAIA